MQYYVSFDRHLTINVCGRAQHGSVCGFPVFLASVTHEFYLRNRQSLPLTGSVINRRLEVSYKAGSNHERQALKSRTRSANDLSPYN